MFEFMRGISQRTLIAIRQVVGTQQARAGIPGATCLQKEAIDDLFNTRHIHALIKMSQALYMFAARAELRINDPGKMRSTAHSEHRCAAPTVDKGGYERVKVLVLLHNGP